MAYVTKPKRGRGPGLALARKFSPEERKKKGPLLGKPYYKAKRTPEMGVISKDVKQAEKKRKIPQRGPAQKMADVEAGVSKQVRKRETGTATPRTTKMPHWRTELRNLLKKISLPKGIAGRATDIIKNSDSRDEAQKLIDKLASKSLFKGKRQSSLEAPVGGAKKGGIISRQAGGKMSHVGLYPAEEKRSGTLPERKRKKGGTMKRKAGGTVKKQVGGLPQGYNARLDESLGARHPAVRGNLAARRAESEGMERALGHRPYSAARTMAKKGGSVSRKKGGTTSRKGGGKIMVGYKAGGKV